MIARETFGRWIRSVREKEGLTLREVSKRTGGKLSYSHLSRIESGDRWTSEASMDAIAEALGRPRWQVRAVAVAVGLTDAEVIAMAQWMAEEARDGIGV